MYLERKQVVKSNKISPSLLVINRRIMREEIGYL
jgi:hypothetical protein